MSACDPFRERLSEPGAVDDAGLQQHLAGCPDCRKDAAVLAALARTRQEPDPVRLTELALLIRAGQARQDAHERRRAPWRAGLLAGGLAVAGAAAIALLMPGRAASPPQTATEVPSPAPASAVAVTTIAEGEAEPLDLEDDPPSLATLLDFGGQADEDG